MGHGELVVDRTTEGRILLLAVQAECGGLEVSLEVVAHFQSVTHPPRSAGRLWRAGAEFAFDGGNRVGGSRIESLQLEEREGPIQLGGMDEGEKHRLALVMIDGLRSRELAAVA